MNRNEPRIEQKKRLFRYACGLAVLIIALILLYSLGRKIETNTAESAQVRGDLTNRFVESRKIEWDGRTYQYRDGLTTILLIGVDKTSTAGDNGVLGFRNGGQADFLMLMVMDKVQKTMTPIQIDRDTMTPITVLDVMGRDKGTKVMQICLSHGFGDGKAQSCEFTKKAVSTLLMDVDIDYYLAFDIDAIEALNDAVGGVTVTLEDDFSAYDPAMKQGATITLHGKQAEMYTRWRMNVGDGTNESRMRRQRVFLSRLADAFRIKMDENANFFNKLYEDIENKLTTDMKRGRLINEANMAVGYQETAIVTPGGEHTIGTDGFMEFHADEKELGDLVVKSFFEPVDKS